MQVKSKEPVIEMEKETDDPLIQMEEETDRKRPHVEKICID
jgi:hypothetical protein